MSLNRMVSFHGGSLASPRPMIRQLGVFTMPQPVIKVEEGLPLVGGGALLAVGLTMKGKGATVMAVLGGLSALIGGGLWAYRALFAGPTTFVAPLSPPPPAPAKPTSATQQLLTQLAPIANQLTPLVKNIFNTTPAPAPAPASQFVTSY